MADRRAEQHEMPIVDWLTGLASRAAFARQVTQAERDRDPFAVVVIRISDFADLNAQLDHDAGDELLRRIGRVLADRTSVDVTAGRLGGAEFGLLAVDVEPGGGRRRAGAVATDLRQAITAWTAHQVAETGVPLVEPQLAVGVSEGCSDRVWVEAALAATVAQHEVDDAVVGYSSSDPRVAALEHRQGTERALLAAVSTDRLATVGRRIEPAGAARSSWTWLRLDAVDLDRTGVPATASTGNGTRRGGTDLGGTRATRAAVTVDTGGLGPTTGRRIERWLMERAATLIGAATGPLRITVPLTAEAAAGRAVTRLLFPVIERYRIPPTRLVFEVDERTWRIGNGSHEVVRQVVDLGSSVVLAGSEGGWHTYEALDAAPFTYVKPARSLVAGAVAGDWRATRVLAALAATAEESELELIGPAGAGSDPSRLGFSFVEAATVEVVPGGDPTTGPEPSSGLTRERARPGGAPQR